MITYNYRLLLFDNVKVCCVKYYTFIINTTITGENSAYF